MCLYCIYSYDSYIYVCCFFSSRLSGLAGSLSPLWIPPAAWVIITAGRPGEPGPVTVKVPLCVSPSSPPTSLSYFSPLSPQPSRTDHNALISSPTLSRLNGSTLSCMALWLHPQPFPPRSLNAGVHSSSRIILWVNHSCHKVLHHEGLCCTVNFCEKLMLFNFGWW